MEMRVLILMAISMQLIVAYNHSSNDTDTVEYVLLDSKHPCARKCIMHSTPMICRYNFSVEWYNTMSKACYDCPYNPDDCLRPDCIPGDGVKRPVLVVNRKMPGPLIDVCIGDEVVINVENHLPAESTTIHWHGHHQRMTPYMDGVPFITQCPITSGTTFTYHFKVENAGTHFWHSHSGFQRADGAFGPFVVRVPETMDPHSHLYDYDLDSHVVVILDWGEEIGLSKFVAHHHGDGDNKAANLLVNGLGRFKQFSKEDNTTIYTPVEKFVVEQNFRYRFRVINAGFLNCPIEISVDNHTLTLISSDGSDFKPIEADSFVTYAGERFDFILSADQLKSQYWMRFSGLMDCDERFTSAHQVAIIQYKGINETEHPLEDPDYAHSKKPGLQVNALNSGTENNGRRSIALPELEALDHWDTNLKEVPDFQYYVSYDFYKIDNPHFHKFPLYGFHNVTNKKQQLLTPQLNHISMKLLPFPLLSQREQITDGMFCNETTVKNCNKQFCECTHTVNIPLNSVVEMVLIDKGFAFDANHPFHLHGHSFRVVAMERLGKNTTVAEVWNRDKAGKIKRNLDNAPIKDTVTVPDGGYTIIRFHATNPGYWLFHCHIEFHVEVGMALVFKIGDDEEMPPVPHGFPKCGDYVSDITNDDLVDVCDKSSTLNSILRKVIPNIFEKLCIPSNNGAFKLNNNLSLMVFVVIFNFIRLY